MNNVALLEHTSPVWRRLMPRYCWWAPRIVYVEPTNACNLRCVFCPQSDSTIDRGTMPLNSFKRVIDALPSVSHIHLYFRGEPTIHPSIVDMADYACRHHQLTITTNGNKSLEGLKATRVKFSFDGVDRDLYSSTRQGGDYDEVMHNVVRATRSGDFKEVWVEVIDHYRGDLRAFASRLYSIGVDKVCVKRYLHWDAPCKSQPSSFPCLLPWHTLGIYYDGTATPCCVDFEGSMAIGNAFDTPPMVLWNNSRIRALRANLKALKYSCQDSYTLLQPYEVVKNG